MTAHNQRLPIILFIRVIAVALLLLGSLLTAAQPTAAQSPYVNCDDAKKICMVTGDMTLAADTWKIGYLYYIINTDHVFNIPAGDTLTIQAGVIVKFLVPYDPKTQTLTSMTVTGRLVLQGTAADPIIFTSGRDDQHGGDTDGSGTVPGAGDWDAVVINDPSTNNPTLNLTNLIFMYGKQGLNIRNSVDGSSITTPVQDNKFSWNVCGLTFSIESTGSINSPVSGNEFTYNNYGLCTRHPVSADSDSGAASPSIQNNVFRNNLTFPISLSSTSYPSYSGNTFEGYDPAPVGAADLSKHLGIELSGHFYGTGTWSVVMGSNGTKQIVIPYVVISPVEIMSKTSALNGNLTIPSGAFFKFYTAKELPTKTSPLPELKISGTINFPNPPDPANPIIFTSYYDDTVSGDTNGNGANSDPAPGDWDDVHFVDNHPGSDAQFQFDSLEFRYAKNGLDYETTLSSADVIRSPQFNHLRFYRNINGLRLVSETNTSHPATRIIPTIQNCSFVENGLVPTIKTQTEPGVPIMLENTVQPTYSNNTFTGNLHPAIGVTGAWHYSATWVSVSGQGLAKLPYLVHGDVGIGNSKDPSGQDSTVTISIPSGTVVKFFVNRLNPTVLSSIVAAGTLDVQSAVGTEPDVFTSYYDTAYGGNTHGDTSNPAPARGDWQDVDSRSPGSHFHNVIVRYGNQGLHLDNQGSYEINSPVTDSTFEQNVYGLMLDVEATGDISSPVTQNLFRSNDYGLVTFALDTSTKTVKTTGISKPILAGNRFESHSQFPIYLDGAASPVYAVDGSGNPTNTFLNNTHRAIALGGYFGSDNDPVYLPQVKGDTNAPFNGKVFPYVVLVNTLFDWQTTTHMDGGLVFKFGYADKLTDPKTYKTLKFLGPLDMATSSAAGDQNYFTSYKDDYYDDTDAVPPDPKVPLTRAEWNGVYVANPATFSFSYSTVKYANYGIVVFQDRNSPGNIQPDISHNTFTENTHGLSLWIESDYDILSKVFDNTFTNNDFGLYTYTNPDPDPSGSVIGPHFGLSKPELRRNSFTNHKEFPIYLNGSADPIYVTTPISDKNIFSGSTHPAIAVAGYWSPKDATWTSVEGDGGKIFPYVVRDDLVEEVRFTDPLTPFPTIRIPPRTVVKVFPYSTKDSYYPKTPVGIFIWGYLIFNSSPGNEIVFTAYTDDTVYQGIGGDTNADINASVPTRSTWSTVWFIDFPGKINAVHDTLTKYAIAGYSIYTDGPDNIYIETQIHQAKIEESHVGLALVIGWRKVGTTIYPGKGDIRANLQNIQIVDDDYGLVTIAHNLATGIAGASLSNVTFTNIKTYPLYLGGTSALNFISGNQIVNTQTAADLLNASSSAAAGEEPVSSLRLMGADLPGNAAMENSLKPGIEAEAAAGRLGNALAVSSTEMLPAIGLAGSWNNSVALPDIPGVPFTADGNFPLTLTGDVFNYTPSKDVVVGEAKPDGTEYVLLTIPAGATFKFNSGLKMDVRGLGELNMLSTEDQPAVFTSFKDDSAMGDTNWDGAVTHPAKGDWLGIRFSSQIPDTKDQVMNPSFHHAIVRYSTEGLHLYFDGLSNQQIEVGVQYNTFLFNVAGMTLTPKTAGDVKATILSNRFDQNDTQMIGNKGDTGSTGCLIVAAHQNDLLGNSTQTGVINNNVHTNPVTEEACVFDATHNYWGDSSGPYHITLNPNGKGRSVSGNVLFNPWDTSNEIVVPGTFNIIGRVYLNSYNGQGLAGVKMTLVPTGTEVTTGQDGYYHFDGVPSGSYTVIPSALGYNFNPPQAYIPLASDASGVNFLASQVTASRTASIASYSFARPYATNNKITITVSLDAPNDTGSNITIKYRTVDGTASGGSSTDKTVDYTTIAETNLVFKPGIQTMTFQVTIKPGTPTTQVEFFTIQISAGSTNVRVGTSVGTINLLPSTPVFIPLSTKSK